MEKKRSYLEGKNVKKSQRDEAGAATGRGETENHENLESGRGMRGKRIKNRNK